MGARSKTGVALESRVSPDADVAMIYVRTGYWDDQSLRTKTAGDIVLTGEDWADWRQIRKLIAQRHILDTLADWVLADIYRFLTVGEDGKLRRLQRHKRTIHRGRRRKKRTGV